MKHASQARCPRAVHPGACRQCFNADQLKNYAFSVSTACMEENRCTNLLQLPPTVTGDSGEIM